MKTTKTKKRVARKAATKKRRSNKAPSAKQLAARRKFALAAKARAKAAKAKKKKTVVSRQKTVANSRPKRRKNKTVIVKPKRVLVINGKKKATKKRNSAKASPKVRQLRETFTGTTSRKTSTMNVADGTPTNLAKLGKLVLVKAAGGTIKPASGTTWLCADAKGKLYFATSAERLYDGPAQNFGEVSQIEYEAIKPHLGHKRPTIFFHKMGEEGGKRPVLIGDGKGGLKLRGGSYKIQREGIVN